MFKGIASRALGVFALFTIVCGLGYTLVVTGVAQLAFPYQANGSLITVDGKVVGSELIGQNFDDEAHMWGRIQNVSIVEGEDGELMAYGAPLQFESSERAALFRCMAIRLSRTGGRWPTAPDGRQPLPRRGPGTCCRRGGRCRGERLNRDVPGPDRATAG